MEINYIGTLLIPLIIIIINVVLSKFLLNRKEKIEIETLKKNLKNLEDRKEDEEIKLKVEVEKLNQEIISLKNSYQPFVFDTLNRIGNELLPRKVKLLENILRIRNNFFDFENSYYEGQRLIDDISDYYLRIARNIDKTIIDDLNKTINIEAYYFNSEIISKINGLSSEFNTLYEYDLYQNSIQNHNIHPEAETCIKKISTLFNEVIELIRMDLQIDNRYIQSFLNKYNTI